MTFFGPEPLVEPLILPPATATATVSAPTAAGWGLLVVMLVPCTPPGVRERRALTRFFSSSNASTRCFSRDKSFGEMSRGGKGVERGVSLMPLDRVEPVLSGVGAGVEVVLEGVVPSPAPAPTPKPFPAPSPCPSPCAGASSTSVMLPSRQRMGGIASNGNTGEPKDSNDGEDEEEAEAGLLVLAGVAGFTNDGRCCCTLGVALVALVVTAATAAAAAAAAEDDDDFGDDDADEDVGRLPTERRAGTLRGGWQADRGTGIGLARGWLPPSADTAAVLLLPPLPPTPTPEPAMAPPVVGTKRGTGTGAVDDDDEDDDDDDDGAVGDDDEDGDGTSRDNEGIAGGGDNTLCEGVSAGSVGMMGVSRGDAAAAAAAGAGAGAGVLSVSPASVGVGVGRRESRARPRARASIEPGGCSAPTPAPGISSCPRPCTCAVSGNSRGFIMPSGEGLAESLSASKPPASEGNVAGVATLLSLPRSLLWSWSLSWSLSLSFRWSFSSWELARAAVPDIVTADTAAAVDTAVSGDNTAGVAVSVVFC